MTGRVYSLGDRVYSLRELVKVGSIRKLDSGTTVHANVWVKSVSAEQTQVQVSWGRSELVCSRNSRKVLEPGTEGV